MSVILWVFIANAAVAVLYLLVALARRACGIFKKLHRKLHSHYAYNGLIRLFLEAYLDFTLL